MGAKVVNVHGETVTEPVEPGTNMAAVSSSNVDILAHPGLITPDEARIASKNGVFLEVSARKGHGFANGHVVKTARQAGAVMVLDSDAHEPGDLLTREFAMRVARGAGLDQADAEALLEDGPRDLLGKSSQPRDALVPPGKSPLHQWPLSRSDRVPSPRRRETQARMRGTSAVPG